MSYSLDPYEKNQLLNVAETCYSVHTVDDFYAWIKGPVKAYFPHQMMIGVLGQMLEKEIRIQHLVSTDCPDKCLRFFLKNNNLAEQSLIRGWLSQYRAQIVDSSDFTTRLSLPEQEEMLELGLTHCAAYGLMDRASLGGSYFLFSKIPGTLTQRHGYLLELLVPYLHQALTRIAPKAFPHFRYCEKGFEQLTKREREILLLMATGMSNRAIAQSLYRSEQTIQNHVHAILKKIGVPNRTAAVAWMANCHGHHPLSRFMLGQPCA